jgi:hypothetical protein
MPISHTFEVESTDHCETPATAYKDVAPALAHLATLMGKSKVRMCDALLCVRVRVAPLVRLCNLPPLARQSCSCGAKHPLSFTPCCRTRTPRSTRAPFLFPRFFLGCGAHVVAACCLACGEPATHFHPTCLPPPTLLPLSPSHFAGNTSDLRPGSLPSFLPRTAWFALRCG